VNTTSQLVHDSLCLDGITKEEVSQRKNIIVHADLFLPASDHLLVHDLNVRIWPGVRAELVDVPVGEVVVRSQKYLSHTLRIHDYLINYK
jgi:hypothetical protein